MELRPYEHWFSKYEDEDFYDDLETKRRNVKYAPAGGAALGGIAGAGLGYMAGEALTKSPYENLKRNRRIGLAAGAVGLGALGYAAGKQHKKSENREADRLERRYRKGSKSDKQYLRKRLSDMERRKLEERKARAQEQIAWNTIWH